MEHQHQTEEDSTLYHMTQKELWVAAKTLQQPYFPPTYQQDGFIHLTKDPNFLLGIGNHFYRDVPGEFLLLCLDASKLSSKVVFEPAAAVGNKVSDGLSGTSTAPLFPHLYGTIDFPAVTRELSIKRDEDGAFLEIVGL